MSQFENREGRKLEIRTENNSPNKQREPQKLKPALKINRTSIQISTEHPGEQVQTYNENYLSPTRSQRVSPHGSKKKISFLSTDSQTTKQIENINSSNNNNNAEGQKKRNKKKNKRKRKLKKKNNNNNMEGEAKESGNSPSKSNKKKLKGSKNSSESGEEDSQQSDDGEDYDDDEEEEESEYDQEEEEESEEASSEDEQKGASENKSKRNSINGKKKKNKKSAKKDSQIKESSQSNRRSKEDYSLALEFKELERKQNMEKEQAQWMNQQQQSQIKTFEQKNKDLELKLKRNTVMLSQAKNKLQIENKEFLQQQNLVEVKTYNTKPIGQRYILFKLIGKIFKCNLLLRSKVRDIANSQGKQTEQHFHILMNYINYHMFGSIIFTCLYVYHLLDTQSDDNSNNNNDVQFGLDYFLTSKLSSSNVGILNVCTFLFIIFTITKLFLHYKNSKQQEVQHQAFAKNLVFFRLAFSEWNWTLCKSAIATQKSQISLRKKVHTQIQENLSSVYTENEKRINLIPFIISFTFTSGLIILGFWSLKVLHDENLQISDVNYLNELIKGVIISIVIIFFSYAASIFTLIECLPLELWRLRSNVIKKFLVQLSLYSFYIFINIAAYRSRETEWMSLVYNFQSQMYYCYLQQIGYTLYGLLFGNFLVMIVLQNLSIFSKYCYSGLIISRNVSNSKLTEIVTNFSEFEVISQTIPYIVQNFICLCTFPFSQFALIVGCLMQFANFFLNKHIIEKHKIPHFTQMNWTEIQTLLNKYKISSFFIAFMIYGFTDDLQLSQQQSLVQINSDGSQNSIQYCGPYISQDGASFSQNVYNFFQGNLEYIFDIIFWKTFLTGISLIFISAFFVKNQVVQYWKKTFIKKNQEFQLMKNMYESKIQLMEKRMQQVQKEIDQNLSSTNILPPSSIENSNQGKPQQQQQQYINTEASEQANLVEVKESVINFFNGSNTRQNGRRMTILDFKNNGYKK